MDRLDAMAKAAIISVIPPVMVKKATNPGGLPMEVFDGFRKGVANRAQFYRDIREGPFYGFNRPGAKISQGINENWWRQGMMGGTKAHYECRLVAAHTLSGSWGTRVASFVLTLGSNEEVATAAVIA